MSLKWLQSYDITRSADSDVGDSDVEKKSNEFSTMKLLDFLEPIKKYNPITSN